jgi:hypothetical protein
MVSRIGAFFNYPITNIGGRDITVGNVCGSVATVGAVVLVWALFSKENSGVMLTGVTNKGKLHIVNGDMTIGGQ